jgi:hypothetical protein
LYKHLLIAEHSSSTCIARRAIAKYKRPLWRFTTGKERNLNAQHDGSTRGQTPPIVNAKHQCRTQNINAELKIVV